MSLLLNNSFEEFIARNIEFLASSHLLENLIHLKEKHHNHKCNTA